MWLEDLIHKLLRRSVPEARPPVYLGAFGTTVEQQQGMGRHLVATEAGWDELDRLTVWCEENGCHCFWDRVLWDKWMNKWSSNGIGGFDVLFIAADDEETAMLARLSWAA
jgi:hypothetical protein